ncbi:MAG: YbhB/YbcL family Raf kinase inhibitor-like protein [Armatimonadetes bacterium]|nr:YbhB/YbcL family Raf kinase inhibitor-like protein [Armatimonadota bacterium]
MGIPGAGQEGSVVAFSLTSPAFKNGDRIPTKYTADGADVSPPLEWTDPPEGTKQFALLCDDPDAPVGIWNHWVIYGLSPELRKLPEGIAKTEKLSHPRATQGSNTWPKTGYWGPAPPKGQTHRYQFKLYALSTELELDPGATRDELLAAMEGSILAMAMLEGTYSR